MEKEITLKDILLKLNKIESNMLTKEEAKNFATKEDLKNFTTKEDTSRIEKQITLMIKELKIHTRHLVRIKHEISELKFVMNGLADDIGMLDERTRSLVVYKKKKTS